MTDMPQVVYEYSQGDLLEDRNTYFYTPYHGKAFLAAWRQSRQSAATDLPAPQPFEFQERPLSDNRANRIDTADLLNHLGWQLSEGQAELTEVQKALLNRLVTKFEVSKRIYTGYTGGFKPIDKTGYTHMGLYVQFAAAMSLAYQKTAGLPYLNVMTKSIDTLIARRDRLELKETAVLAHLIEREDNYVAAVAENVEVDL